MTQNEIKAIRDLKVINPNDIPHFVGEGEIGAVLEWSVQDPKNGKIQEHVIQKSESFVKQFLQLLICQMAGIPSNYPKSIMDTGNTLRNITTNLAGADVNTIFDVSAGVGNVLLGIVVGTGAVAATISDYVLGNLIANGGGGGQLNYGAVSFGAPASDSTTSQITITRNFSNASGGDITLTEIGLYCKARDNTGSDRYFLIIRDVIGGGILIPNGQTLTVNYRPQAVI